MLSSVSKQAEGVQAGAWSTVHRLHSGWRRTVHLSFLCQVSEQVKRVWVAPPQDHRPPASLRGEQISQNNVFKARWQEQSKNTGGERWAQCTHMWSTKQGARGGQGELAFIHCDTRSQKRTCNRRPPRQLGDHPGTWEGLTEPARTSGAGGASAYTLGPVFYCSATLHTLFITYRDAFCVHLPCWTRSLTQQFLAQDRHVTNAWHRDPSHPLSPTRVRGRCGVRARSTTNRLQAPLRTGTTSDLLMAIFSIV